MSNAPDQVAMYWRVHRALADRLIAYSDMQRGEAPMSESEYCQLQAKRPERWAGIPYLRPTKAG